MPNFGHSEFLPIFLGKIVRKNSEWPFLPIPNFFQSFLEKLIEKFRMAIFAHSKFIPVFLGKIVGKNSEQQFLAIPNLYQSFWGKLLEKIWNSHCWPFQFSSHFSWEKLSKWPFQFFSDNFSQKDWYKFGMAIYFFLTIFPKKWGEIQNGHFFDNFPQKDWYKFGMAKMVIPNFFQQFSEKDWYKFGMAKSDCFKFF